jgi:hypothetical protein
MARTSPADELAEIRAELQRLKIKETLLVDMLMARPEQNRVGRYFLAEIRPSQIRPSKILPSYSVHGLLVERARDCAWQDKVKEPDHATCDTGFSPEVICVAVVPTVPARPGWPIARAPASDKSLLV